MRMAISKENHTDIRSQWIKIRRNPDLSWSFRRSHRFYAEPETLQSGVDRIDFGNAKMQIFDKDRLICECLKYEDKMERAVFQEGVLSYIKDEKKDIANLMKYARERRVVKKVQSMIGVWL